MILKRQGRDESGRMITHWTPGIESALRCYDENWQTDVIETRFADGHPPERVLLNRGEGVYLCSDEGRTIEVLSRLTPLDPPAEKRG